MIKKLLSLTSLVFVLTQGWSQSFNLYSDNFEFGLSSAWTLESNSTVNNWILNSCAGNGINEAGTESLYVTKGGIDPDCGNTGMYQYAYDNEPTGSSSCSATLKIFNNCAFGLGLSLDYNIIGDANDYLEILYTIDFGATYQTLGILPASLDWTSTTIPLPAELDYTPFYIKFNFHFNDSDVIGNPPAIDNIIISGNDNEAPTVVCPSNIMASVDDDCLYYVRDYRPDALISDNCIDITKLIITQTPTENTVILNSGQSQMVTILVEDLAGNSSSCTFEITTFDNTAPTVTCPTIAAPLELNANCQAAIPDLSSGVTWSDNCTTDPLLMVFAQSPPSGTLISTGQAVEYTVTDPSGNVGSCSTTINLVDNISPVLTCPSDLTEPLNSSCVTLLNDYTSLVSVEENCFFNQQVLLTQSPAVGTSIDTPTLLTITGEDEAGNQSTCTFTVTPIDNSAPIINCPLSYSISTNIDCISFMPDVTSLVSTFDNCTAPNDLVITQMPLTGSSLPLGITQVVVEVADQVGNMATCSFEISVEDLTAPDITCTGNVTVTIDDQCQGVIGNYSSNLVASDNCTATSLLVVSQSPIEGTIISTNTQIEFTVIDEAGVQSTCNFFAVIEDLTEPEVICPNSVSVTINSSCQYTVPDILPEVTGTDNCSAFSVMTLTQNPVFGSLESGLTAVLITLQDEAGNQGTCITLLIPDDNEAPIITCPSPVPVNNGSNCTYVLPNFSSTTLVLDNCSNFVIEQQPPTGTVIQMGTHMIEMTVSDVAGNMASCSFELVVTENVIPTITCPTNITSCDPNVVYLDPLFNDNCEVTLTQTDNTGLSSGSLFPVGFTLQSFAVTDLSGNSSSCSFVVEVLDFPAQSNIPEDTLFLCETTSTVVSAEAHTTGSGEWTVLSGNGNFNNQFASTTGINNLSYGTNVLVYTIGSASCGFTSDTLVIIASQQPLPASTQDTIYTCASNEVVLLSNTPLYGNGIWTTNDANAVIGNASSSNTSATSISAGWHEYVWTITNGSCLSTSDTLRVFTSQSATISTADTLICFENQELTIIGVVPTDNETVFWKFIKGVGILSDPVGHTTTISGLNLGENILVYTVLHPTCPSSTDTITIVTQICNELNPDFPTVITPNNDGKNDLFVINFLEQIYPDLQVTIFNRWGSVVFKSTGYEVPWDGTYNGEPLPMGTYFYRIELNDSEEKVYTGPISIIR
jgi:gliding motility-associated-like protein